MSSFIGHEFILVNFFWRADNILVIALWLFIRAIAQRPVINLHPLSLSFTRVAADMLPAKADWKKSNISAWATKMDAESTERGENHETRGGKHRNLILSSSRGPSSVPSITSSITRKSWSAWMKRITIYASLKYAILSLHPTCGYLLSDALLFFCFFVFYPSRGYRHGWPAIQPRGKCRTCLFLIRPSIEPSSFLTLSEFFSLLMLNYNFETAVLYVLMGRRIGN
jgi:hypothetical protein